MPCKPASSKVEKAYDRFQANILKGTWPVGHVIPNESQLAVELHSSRPTISKAISRLEHEGYVERRRRVGTRVLRNAIEGNAPKVQLDAYAFIFPSKKHEGLRRILQGFQNAAYDLERRSLTLATGPDYRKEIEMLGRLSEFDVRGCVISPSIMTFEDRIHFSQILLSRKVPYVLAGLSFPGSGVPSVDMDGFHAGFTVTQHLLSLGARKIGFFASNMLAPIARDKYLGYRRAMEDAGLAVESAPDCAEMTEHADYDDPTAEPMEMARAYLKKHETLDGVVCLYDFLALGLIKAALELGLRVPEDLKVVGVDGFGESEGLTTYRVPYEQIGSLAVRLLDRLVNGEKLERLEFQLPGELIVRKSA
jgi:GntR family transcriptional regulator, arabinose operon transcriptional repressor